MLQVMQELHFLRDSLVRQHGRQLGDRLFARAARRCPRHVPHASLLAPPGMTPFERKRLAPKAKRLQPKPKAARVCGMRAPCLHVNCVS